MNANLRVLLVAALAMLAGCELVVDPKTAPGTTGQTTAGFGSSTQASSSSSASSTTEGASVGSSGRSSSASATSTSATGNSSSGTHGSSSSGSTLSSSSASSSGSSSTLSTSSSSSNGGIGSTGSSSGAGSTGGACTGPFEGTNGQLSGNGCVSVGLTGTSAVIVLAPPSDWPLTAIPDSISNCGSSCPDAGTDEDYTEATDTLCSEPSLTHSASAGSQTPLFAQSNITQLMWQTDDSFGPSDFSTANTVCTSGWSNVPPGGQVMLPTPSALLSLIQFSGNTNVYPVGIPDTDSSGHWSYWAKGSGQEIWSVNFADGTFLNVSEQNVSPGPLNYARCVVQSSSGSPAVIFSCTASGNASNPASTCTEELTSGNPMVRTTGLHYFIPTTPVGPYKWGQALDVCNQLPACGRWRLPSYKELVALVNFTDSPTGAAPVDGLVGEYWSSTDLLNGTDSAMGVTFIQPSSTIAVPNSSGFSAPKTAAKSVLCVSGPGG